MRARQTVFATGVGAGGAGHSPPVSKRRDDRPRAFRGLALVFGLSFLNLVGLSLTAAGLGGLAPWSRWQFIGAFGVLEAAVGLANVLSPNLWRRPIAQLQTSERADIRLAASTVLIPH